MFEFIKNLFAREPEYNEPKACCCKKELVLLPEPVKTAPVKQTTESNPVLEVVEPPKTKAPAKPKAVKAPAKPKPKAVKAPEVVEEVKEEIAEPKKRGRKPAVKK